MLSLNAAHQEEEDTPVLGGTRGERCARIPYPLTMQQRHTASWWYAALES